MSYVQLRISIDGTATAAQLGALRRWVPELARIAPSALRAGLASTPTCVIGAIPEEKADEIERALRAADVRVERFTLDEYTAGYVRDALPQPPTSWTSAGERVEAVLMPAFHPEVVLRAWSDDEGEEVQLATLQASVFEARFCPPGWLIGMGASGAREDAWEERARASAGDLYARAWAVEEATARIGLDGMSVTLGVRHRGRERVLEVWSPTDREAGDVWRVLAELHRVARAHLRDARSQGVLGRVRGYLGVR